MKSLLLKRKFPTYRFISFKVMSRIELLVSLNQVEFELKQKFVTNSSRVSNQTNFYRVESSWNMYE